MHENIIEFIGLDDLDEAEKAELNRLSTEYYQKLKTALNNVTSLIVHVKKYKKEGTRHKYSIHIRLIAPTRAFESTKAVDWDFARTLHKSFKNLEHQIKHRLHTDDQKPRS